MKKLLHFKTVLFAFIVIYACSASFRVTAQTTCGTATQTQSSTNCSYSSYQITTTDYWLKFTAASTHVVIGQFYPDYTPVAPINQIILYSGNCAALVQIALNNTNLVIDANNLTIGNNYYIKVSQPQAITGYFALGIQDVATPCINPIFVFCPNNSSATICCGQSVCVKNLTSPSQTSGSFNFIVTRPTDGAPINIGSVLATSFQYGQTFTFTPPCDVFALASGYTLPVNMYYSGSCSIHSTGLSLTVYPNPTATASSSPSSICQGQSSTLTATGGGTYLWSNGATTASTVVSPTATTIYGVTVTNNYNCTNQTQVWVTVNTYPSFTISGNNNNCNPQPHTYYISNFSSNYTWSWSVNGGASHSFSSNSFSIDWGPNGLNLPGGTITVTANNNGCITTQNFIVSDCCDRTADYTYNDATINSSVTIPTNRIIVINGTLNITHNGSIYPTVVWQQDQVYLGPYAKILVDVGCTLRIERASVLQACDTILWDGIYVTSNAQYPALVSINGSTVKDALNAVVSKAGGNYNISASTMTNNYKNIVVRYYNAIHPGHINATLINNTSVLLYPYHNRGTYIGIEADSVKCLFIGDSTSLSRNHFDIYEYGNAGTNAIYGIRATDSYVRVFNNWFSNIKANVSYINPTYKSYYAIYADAINASSSYPFALLKVGGNRSTTNIKYNIFQNCENGIYTVDNKYVYILGNRLEYTTGGNDWGKAIDVDFNSASTAPVTINSDTIVTYKQAVDVTNSNALTASCNIINLKEPVTTQLFYSRGIITYNCQNAAISNNAITGPTGGNGDYRIEGLRVESGPGTIMTCNSSSTVGRAITFGGVCTPSTTFGKNIMQNTYDGLLLNWAYIGQQGAVNNPNDNQWVAPFGNSYTFSSYSNGNQSPIYVRNTGILPLDPTSATMNKVDPGPPWTVVAINETPGTSTIRCVTCTGGMMMSQSEEPLEVSTDDFTGILQGTSTTQMNNEEKWLTKYSLYNDVLLNNLPTSGSLSNFMQTNQNTDIGQLTQVNSLIENGNYTLAQLTNNGISASNTMAANLKNFYSLYSSNLLNGNKYSLTIAQRETLTDLAQQCPYVYGPAVYHARAYLKACGDTLGYENLCEMVLPSNSNAKLANPDNTQQETPINVYPNPANNNVTVDLGNIDNGKCTFELYDAIGNRIFSKEIAANQNSIIIPLDNVAKGVYLCKIMNSNNIKLYNSKLVIIK